MPDVIPDDDNDSVPLVQFGPYGGKKKIPVHHDYVPLVIARTWNYHDDPTHLAFTTLRAEQLLAIEKAARKLRDGLPGTYFSEMQDALDALRPAAPGTPE